MHAFDFENGKQLVAGFRNAIEEDASVMLRASRRGDPTLEFARSVVRSLSDDPPFFDCRFLYDEHGSALYERICEQPEYYPTRTEASILARHAPEIRDTTGAVTLLELGSGSSVKTDHLLNAYLELGEPVSYVPIDVSESALEGASKDILRRHPGVRVVGVNGTYEDAFPLLPAATPAMVVFLGGTIGNLNEEQTTRFWSELIEHLVPGDYFLLGVDLVKDTTVLEAAYNDAAGVTEQFTRNLFERMNRELGSTIDVDSVEHVARYNPEGRRIEIYARFTTRQAIDVPTLDRRFEFEPGDQVMVEISRKFDLDELREDLERSGLRVQKVLTDARNWFGLLLLQRADGDGRGVT